ncbi:AAA domain-containing protein, partial [Treponema sp. R80B11-R83G3]
INQRQIDIMIKETLPLLKDVNPQNIGIIAPYKDQVSAIKRQLDSRPIEVDTVHKFQGREKDTILLTTVDDVVTDFSDDPYLLNVAISRAKKRLILVVSGNEQPENSIIGDLISYIEYNNYKIFKSEIRSIFDLLYRQYTDARITFLEKHSNISVYTSENLMYGTIVNILKLEKYSNLSINVICHQPLNMLIYDPKFLSDEERRYAMNPSTHIDFLLYNQTSKKPVLAIEVDGFHNHKSGTKQYDRDRLKDHILELYKIPLLRFPTNGSEECAKIERFLTEYANKSR